MPEGRPEVTGRFVSFAALLLLAPMAAVCRALRGAVQALPQRISGTLGARGPPAQNWNAGLSELTDLLRHGGGHPVRRGQHQQPVGHAVR